MKISAHDQRRLRTGNQNGTASAKGFTLVETCIALLIMLIVSLGAASLFAVAASNNSGAADRQLSMAVAQDRMEQLRNVVFTDPSLDVTSTAGTTETVTNARRSYLVTTVITGSNTVNGLPTVKTISIRVSPIGAGPAWSRMTSIFGSVTVVSQRSSLLTGTHREL
ncbi:MAG TPA: prepilin-type N-terminal cleavage/methylation domain-containing protein [Pyrinomonadaceae bacterium]|jgi:prepilin-type N-terminal cleavage/methylation domain-containing protein|nr:prepilin-type N-terminal cleavage/methylation domain-containing protein [Pyrinomonadaceae bacterium]